METPPPEIDNIIEDSLSVTLIPLSIDTIEEEDIFTSTTDTIPENILPAGKHYYYYTAFVSPFFIIFR